MCRLLIVFLFLCLVCLRWSRRRRRVGGGGEEGKSSRMFPADSGDWWTGRRGGGSEEKGFRVVDSRPTTTADAQKKRKEEKVWSFCVRRCVCERSRVVDEGQRLTETSLPFCWIPVCCCCSFFIGWKRRGALGLRGLRIGNE